MKLETNFSSNCKTQTFYFCLYRACCFFFFFLSTSKERGWQIPQSSSDWKKIGRELETVRKSFVVNIQVILNSVQIQSNFLLESEESGWWIILLEKSLFSSHLQEVQLTIGSTMSEPLEPYPSGAASATTFFLWAQKFNLLSSNIFITWMQKYFKTWSPGSVH